MDGSTRRGHDGSLPHLDEHETSICASVEQVWPALLESLDRAFCRPGAASYARLVGAADVAEAGPRPLAEGSTVPGFHVTVAAPPGELVLEGSHRFSTYALVFRLEQVAPGRTRLRAESRASFPGPHGRLYRALVIGTRGHVLGVRGLLAGVRRRAEA